MIGVGRQVVGRMGRAALADRGLYWELAFDAGAIRQSLLAVVIVAGALGIGSAVYEVAQGAMGGAVDGLGQGAVDGLGQGAVGGALSGFVSMGLWGMLYWLLFSVFAWALIRLPAGFYEVKIERVTYLQFVRRFGFVFTPGILLVLTPVPFVGEAAALMAFIWMALAAAIAIQLTVEAPIGLSLMASFIGMVVALLVSALALVYVLGYLLG